MTKYVLGFLFNDNKNLVALIGKLKPEWQKGMMNGIGGKVEPTDITTLDAMRREFKEETGVYVEDWKLFAAINGPSYSIQCFTTNNSEALSNCITTEDEQIHIIEVDTLYKINVIPNLRWLIPLAQETEIEYVIINYIK